MQFILPFKKKKSFSFKKNKNTRLTICFSPNTVLKLNFKLLGSPTFFGLLCFLSFLSLSVSCSLSLVSLYHTLSLSLSPRPQPSTPLWISLAVVRQTKCLRWMLLLLLACFVLLLLRGFVSMLLLPLRLQLLLHAGVMARVVVPSSLFLSLSHHLCQR